MNQLLRRRKRDDDGTAAAERVAETSPDLAYELQSKMFDQLATIGIGGAGLAITLIGSVLRNAPGIVWFSVICFVVAALTAISGNRKLVERLALRQPCMQRSKQDLRIALLFIGIGIGGLSFTVYAESAGQTPRSGSTSAVPPGFLPPIAENRR